MDIYFSENYDESSLFLMEVPPHILTYIRNNEGELIIKGKDISILCTKDKNYELKFLETSNTFLILDSENENTAKKDISLMTFHTLECNEMTPNKYYLYNILKQRACISYSLQDSSKNLENFNLKITKEQGFKMTDYPTEKYEKLLEENNIFLYDGIYLCMFDMEFAYPILTSLLKNLTIENKDTFYSEDEPFDLLANKDKNYEQIISQLTPYEKKNLLSYLFDVKNNEYYLSMNKTKLFIAKSIFYFNYKDKNFDFKLDEFVRLFSNALSMYLPSNVSLKELEESERYLSSSDCADNLYEYYSSFDLRFLNKNCIIYKNKTFKEPLIKWIDLSILSVDFEERIKQIYEIKEKWTMKEIKMIFEDLEMSNLNDKIKRITQIVQEVNLFKNDKKITYLYLKKNPFYKK